MASDISFEDLKNENVDLVSKKNNTNYISRKILNWTFFFNSFKYLGSTAWAALSRYIFLFLVITASCYIDYICVGKHSNWGGLSAAKMYKRGSGIRGRREEAPNFWTQQARGENGEQVPQVFGFYVESIIMGYGVSCYHGHCIGQWRGT